MITFYKWLKNQQHRDDPVGDLSTDIYRDTDIKEVKKNRTSLRSYIFYKSSTAIVNNSENVMAAFDQAWKEYKEYRKTI